MTSLRGECKPGRGIGGLPKKPVAAQGASVTGPVGPGGGGGGDRLSVQNGPPWTAPHPDGAMCRLILNHIMTKKVLPGTVKTRSA